jgi:DNA-binding transcriptional MerR regulator
MGKEAHYIPKYFNFLLKLLLPITQEEWKMFAKLYFELSGNDKAGDVVKRHWDEKLKNSSKDKSIQKIQNAIECKREGHPNNNPSFWGISISYNNENDNENDSDKQRIRELEDQVESLQLQVANLQLQHQHQSFEQWTAQPVSTFNFLQGVCNIAISNILVLPFSAAFVGCKCF